IGRDRSEAADRRFRSTYPSVRFADHESEGHDEEFIALIVAGMQDPVAPILQVALVSEGLHDAGRVIACRSEIVHHGAAVIDEKPSSDWSSGNIPGSR